MRKPTGAWMCVQQWRTTYKPGMFVALSKNNSNLINFGLIIDTLCKYDNEPAFLILQQETIQFDNHWYCYVVKDGGEACNSIVSLSSLIDHYPFEGIKEKNTNVTEIRLKYSIWSLTTKHFKNEKWQQAFLTPSLPVCFEKRPRLFSQLLRCRHSEQFVCTVLFQKS